MRLLRGVSPVVYNYAGSRALVLRQYTGAAVAWGGILVGLPSVSLVPQVLASQGCTVKEGRPNTLV